MNAGSSAAVTSAERLGPVGFGAAPIGNLYRPVSDAAARAALEAAWEGGIRYYDTAPHYGLGLSERRVGAFLAEQPRAEFVVSTKVGRVLDPNPGFAGGDDLAHGVAVTGRSRYPLGVRSAHATASVGSSRNRSSSVRRSASMRTSPSPSSATASRTRS